MEPNPRCREGGEEEEAAHLPAIKLAPFLSCVSDSMQGDFLSWSPAKVGEGRGDGREGRGKERGERRVEEGDGTRVSGTSRRERVNQGGGKREKGWREDKRENGNGKEGAR